MPSFASASSCSIASKIVQNRLVLFFEPGRTVCLGVVSCASRVDSHGLVKIAPQKMEDGLLWFLASSFASALACSIVEQCLRVVGVRGVVAFVLNPAWILIFFECRILSWRIDEDHIA